ncbi:MAG TPA: DUF222 domain-containing protein, partial [Acidimicrobiales bacterium]|nr:DUF222 domain-containing protein [Acidimicrobiales bacterium]
MSPKVLDGKRSNGKGGGLRARLNSATSVLADLVRELEPARLTGPDAKELYAAFVAAERFCVAAKTLLAPRIDDTSVWAEDGHNSAASFLASMEGVPVSQARSTLELGHNLDQLPDTTEAIRQGKLSRPKAAEVVGAALLDPESEGELLDGAEELPHHQLKERCQRSKAASAHHDPIAATKRIYAARMFRSWSDHEGAFCYEGRDTADRGAQILRHLNSVASGLRRERRAERKEACAGTKSGRPGPDESENALKADAFFALATRSGPGSRSGPGGTGRATGRGGVPGKTPASRTKNGCRQRPDPDVDPDAYDAEAGD